jgi:hypothetical protein
MCFRFSGSLAAVLEPPCEFAQRQPDCVTDRFQLQYIYAPLTLFIFADTRLRDPDPFGKLGLSQFRLDSNAAKQPEEYFPIALSFSRESSDPLHIGSIGII